MINVLVSSLGFYWPSRYGSGAARGRSSRSIIVLLAAINVRGIRQSSFVVNVLTVGKLAAAGDLHRRRAVVRRLVAARVRGLLPTAAEPVGERRCCSIYAFGGYEVVPVPGGEARNPRRDVPFALIMTILIVDGGHDTGADRGGWNAAWARQSKTPLTDAAAAFLGAAAPR